MHHQQHPFLKDSPVGASMESVVYQPQYCYSATPTDSWQYSNDTPMKQIEGWFYSFLSMFFQKHFCQNIINALLLVKRLFFYVYVFI